MSAVHVLNRLGALLRHLDEQPAYGTRVKTEDVRRLLVGDLDEPTYVAVPTSELAWLYRIKDAAEVMDHDYGLPVLRHALADGPGAVRTFTQQRSAS